MALMLASPAPRRLQAVDLSMPTALAALIESSRLTDAERFLYNGFALQRLETARQELQRLTKAGTTPGAE
jgi:hypothetical protein